MSGHISLVRNQTLLHKLDQSKFSKPGIKMSENGYRMDELGLKNMSKVSIKQNIFVEGYDPTMKGSQMTIVPIELSLDFGFAQRKGIKSYHGPTQEFATEYLGFNLELKEC